MGKRWGVVLVLGATACAGRQDRVIGQSSDPDPSEEATEPDSGPAFVYLDDEEAESAADRDPRALTEFRATLAGHGNWVDDPSYGTVWVPDGPADFAPYRTGGHWELDPDGNWVWASDYPWGEVTFHYGRWSWGEGVGWFWVPGYEYAPAWVVWESGVGNEYVGWAPAPPAFYWRHRVATAAPRPNRLWFCFAPSSQIFNRELARHLVRDPVRLRRIGARSHVVAHPVPVRTTATQAPAHVPARAVPRPAGSPVRRPVAASGGYPISPSASRPSPSSAPAQRAAPVRVWRIPVSSLPSRGIAPDTREARTVSPPPRPADPRPFEFRHAPAVPAGVSQAPARSSSPMPPSSPRPPVVAPAPRGSVSPPPPATAPARPPMPRPPVAPRPAERPAGHDDHAHRRR